MADNVSGNAAICVFLLLLVLKLTPCAGQEPQHCSRYHYEEKLLEKVIRMELKIEELGKQIKELRDRPTASEARIPSVVFKSVLSRDIGQVQSRQTIIFDQVDLNHGNAYSSRNGFFTAPHNGTYLFSLKLGNPGGKAGVFFLIQNGEGIEYVIAGQTSGWNVGGGTTLTEMIAGDQVWVQGEGHVSGTHPTRRYHTTFAGVLLQISQ